MVRLPFCPDHRDKVWGLSCRQCEIERLQRAKSMSIESLIKERDSLQSVINTLSNMKDNIDSQIYRAIKAGPTTYGRCIKRLVCRHQSDIHNTGTDSIIEVGDVIKFDRYPLYKHASFNPSSGEYFDVPLSEEHFEMFTSSEYIECRSFNSD